MGHTSVSEFYVDIWLWPQIYWPGPLTLSSAQGRWPEGMMNRSSSASSTGLTPYHPLQLSAKGAHNVSKSVRSSFETISSSFEIF